MRLGELISKAKTERCGDRSFPVLSMTMHDGIIAQSERFKKAIASKDVSSYKVVYPGQLVVGFPIDEGVIYVQGFDKSGIMSPAYNVWDIDASIVFPGYLELALHGPSCMAYYADKMRGTTARRRTLTSDNLTAMSIPLPDFSQQKRIVDIFGTVRAQMNVCRRQFSLFDNLVKSRFVEMFGDPSDNSRNYQVVSIGEILSVQPSNGLYKPQKDYVTDGSGVPIIRIDSFNEEGPNYSALKRLNCTQKETEKYGLRDGDIVVNRVNSIGCMGKTMLIDHLPEVVVFESNMMRMHVEESTMFPRFLRHQMTSDYAKHYFESHAKKAIGQASINQADVKGLKVLVPPYVDQKSFLDFAAEVDKSRVVVQRQVVKYNDVIASSGIATIGRGELV
ncbi:restriction endonuclease subunit S [Enorma massiliensis]|uniref:restriction endonuclease subunit S n=1 Tax=Enorma massiliensis TaxID=1472761 RepID=UPI0034A5A078